MLKKKTISILLLSLTLVLVGLGTINLMAISSARAADVFSPGRFDDPVPDPVNCVSCSLREVIIKANNNGVTDTINLPAGVYSITNQTQADDPNNLMLPGDDVGDLDIKEPLTIIGAGAEQTIIDANGLSRVLHLGVDAGLVTISGVTIRNGEHNGNGGGILVHNSAELNLMNSIVTSNTLTLSSVDSTGGGIYSLGKLTLTNVLVTHNTADGGAGGIRSWADTEIVDSIIAYIVVLNEI